MAQRRRLNTYSDWQREQRRQQQEADRARRAQAALDKAAAKAERERYLSAQKALAEGRTSALANRVEALQTILLTGVRRPSAINLAALRRQLANAVLDLGELGTPSPAPEWVDFVPTAPGRVSRLFGGQQRYQEQWARAQEQFERAQAEHRSSEIKRHEEIARLRRDHSAKVRVSNDQIRQHNESVDRLISGVRNRDADAVTGYLKSVLEAMPLPDGLPRNADLIYNPHGEQVVVKWELPGRDVVPVERAYQFVQSRDEHRATPRPAKEIAELYRGAVAQIALLCVRDLFEADKKLESIGFNGHVWRTNPATGQREFPCLISVHVSRDDIAHVNFAAVNSEVCLRSLNSIVSPHPFDVEPVEPILDFDLSKFKFVEGLDAVSFLDSRPDLMRMHYTHFEHLVKQVFEASGLQGWVTTQNYDDGVDAVIQNTDPLVGGLAIVQAKRWSKAIGVSHIRELAGAIEEKKAGRGILVTTSWFTKVCYDKAREHGRIELIDGSNLKSLIKTHLGKDVLIGIPGRPKSSGPTA